MDRVEPAFRLASNIACSYKAGIGTVLLATVPICFFAANPPLQRRSTCDLRCGHRDNSIATHPPSLA
jgi:hypothetical protein